MKTTKSIYQPNELWEALEKLASADNRSLNNWLEITLSNLPEVTHGNFS